MGDGLCFELKIKLCSFKLVGGQDENEKRDIEH